MRYWSRMNFSRPSSTPPLVRLDGLCARPVRSFARIAFSRSGDPATGEFGDAKLIRKFGDVPEDLSAL
jgi:hypothetical protein